MKYFMYLRVSTTKQEDSGLGLDAQRHACKKWIEENGGGEFVEYIDIVTGTDKNRKELEQRPKLLEALSELTKGDILIVHKRERLGRDPYVNCMIERIIEKKKARLISAVGEMDGDEPHDVLMRRIMDAFAEYEALIISTRTKAALARKKAKGERVGHIPYGKKLDKKGELKPVAEEQHVIRNIHGLFNAGNTCRQVAQQLNVEGYSNRGGQPWTHGAVNRIYKNNLITV